MKSGEVSSTLIQMILNTFPSIPNKAGCCDLLPPKETIPLTGNINRLMENAINDYTITPDRSGSESGSPADFPGN